MTLTFEYVGVDGKVQTNVSYLDWSEINARTYAVKKSVHHVAKEMAKIQEILEKRAAPLRRREQGTGPEPTRQQPGVLARIYERLTGGLGQ
ncbi:hypothetical protein GYH36_01195 [Cellulosimicrobium cellulans]|uniref:Uncharacterized protein n=1 Tax=Cellulosimicrobium composti TaxID=2672572 RepID=A0ABX0B6Q8_9MICO|nr:hypothetical protein [Cellulosimicrobium composti]